MKWLITAEMEVIRREKMFREKNAEVVEFLLSCEKKSEAGNQFSEAVPKIAQKINWQPLNVAPKQPGTDVIIFKTFSPQKIGIFGSTYG
jgi:hypothetical protein